MVVVEEDKDFTSNLDNHDNYQMTLMKEKEEEKKKEEERNVLYCNTIINKYKKKSHILIIKHLHTFIYIYNI